MDGPRTEATLERPPSLAISNLTVHIVREYTGRGPTKARTYTHDSLITVVLQDALTKGERHLVEDGAAEHVLRTRKMFQHAMREALVAGIEGVTGRRVIAFLSDNHIEPDVAVEVFVLEPLNGEPGFHPKGADAR
jgi:uncharacterized protein YbcI